MNIIHKPEATQFVHLFCEGSILCTYVIGLAMTVVIGVWMLELLYASF